MPNEHQGHSQTQEGCDLETGRSLSKHSQLYCFRGDQDDVSFWVTCYTQLELKISFNLALGGGAEFEVNLIYRASSRTVRATQKLSQKKPEQVNLPE